MPIVMTIFESHDFKYYQLYVHTTSMNFKLYLQYYKHNSNNKQDTLNVYIRVSSIPLRTITVTFLSVLHITLSRYIIYNMKVSNREI